MSKTLTEQWKDGELPNGYYWCRILDNEEDAFMQHLIAGHFQYSPSFIKEVLAPVPSYEEFVQQRDFVKDHQKVLIENMNLKRKLEIATKALESIASRMTWNEISQSKAEQALKEMEGVK